MTRGRGDSSDFYDTLLKIAKEIENLTTVILMYETCTDMCTSHAGEKKANV